MDWQDRGLIIGVRKHGETSVILEVLTGEHGRHMGLVRGGRSRAMQPILQAGNSVDLTWRARLEEHLGTFVVEGERLRAADLMQSALGLHGLHHLAGLLRLLPERDPHPRLWRVAEVLADRLDDAALAPALMLRFEFALLAELGFGLDLTECTLTGATEDLIYVSPKSGRAVGRTAGEPWRDRLLPLPVFLLTEQHDADADQLSDAFRLLEHFLTRDVLAPRGLTIGPSRSAFQAEAERSFRRSAIATAST
ncbi:MAG: repair protein RecO [Methylobacteriaceae bacterium]|jgi:DNA repair protein RecO (recombination protein O)|nr:repair protein RecO [Methylobacteriaceae bacterium]